MFLRPKASHTLSTVRFVSQNMRSPYLFYVFRISSTVSAKKSMSCTSAGTCRSWTSRCSGKCIALSVRTCLMSGSQSSKSANRPVGKVEQQKMNCLFLLLAMKSFYGCPFTLGFSDANFRMIHNRAFDRASSYSRRSHSSITMI
jgi:hypothetical protein